MSARLFDAAEAHELGIIARRVSGAALDEAVEAEVAPYLSVAPGAVAAAKAHARSLGSKIDEAVIVDSIQRLADTWEGEEAAHGVAAFLSKEDPDWAK